MARPEKTHPLYIWRKANGDKPLQEIARLAGCSQPHLSEIENGNNLPSISLAARLHSLTGIEIEEFVKAGNLARQDQ